MKIYYICLIVTFLTTQVATAQEIEKQGYIRTRPLSPEGKPKFYKNSEIEISDEEFQKLLKKHGSVGMIPIIDKYGERAAFYIDTINTSGVYKSVGMKTSPGDQFPTFVMKGYNGEVFDSDELRGKKVVMYFRMFFGDEVHEKDWMEDFRSQLHKHQGKEALFLLVIPNSRTEMDEIIGDHEVEFNLVTDAENFRQRFGVIHFPSFVVIDESGKLIRYLERSEFDELEDLL